MQGLLRDNKDRMHDRVIAGLALYDGSSSLCFKCRVQNIEKTTNCANFDILLLCYAKTTDPVISVLENEDPWQQIKE